MNRRPPIADVIARAFLFNPLPQEVISMRNQPSKDRLARIPRLYATEHTPLQDKLIHLHLFVAGSDFYIAEYDGQDILLEPSKLRH
jgi:hypothetical protein